MRTGKSLCGIIGTIFVVMLVGTMVQAQTIHLVTVADFRSFSGAGLESVKGDVEKIRQFFCDNVPAASLKVYNVDGNMATPEAVCEKVESVQAQSDDTLVFYYSGHAANAAEHGGQYFELKDKKMKNTPLQRSKIRNMLCEKNVRLVVLLTDCCNVFKPLEPDKNVDLSTRGAPSAFSPVIKALFLKPRGVADITSSKINQFSFTGKTGCIATVAWLKTFNELNNRLKSNPSQEIEWESTLQEFCVAADKEFKSMYPNGHPEYKQRTQIPHAFELPRQPRFGVRVITLEVGNLQVAEVLSGSPGATIGLKKGDIITKINNEEVLDESS